MPPSEHELGAAELEVLKVLWEQGPSTVREVLGHLRARGRKLAYTTVLTFLTRLETKGFVHSDKSSMAYIYRPAVTRQKITRTRLRAVIEELYDGAAGPMVLQLVKSEKLSADEIAELQSLIDSLDARTRKGGRRGSS